MTRDALEYRDVINRIASAMMAFLVIFSVLNNIAFYTCIKVNNTITAYTTVKNLIFSWIFVFKQGFDKKRIAYANISVIIA